MGGPECSHRVLVKGTQEGPRRKGQDRGQGGSWLKIQQPLGVPQNWKKQDTDFNLDLPEGAQTQHLG